jgi:drug/metabolite transporter (DMT)-like permease
MAQEDGFGGAAGRVEAEGNPSARAALVVGVCAVSFSSIVSRLTAADPVAIAFYRQFLAAIILLPFAFGKRDELLRLSKKEWALLLASGFFLALHFATWITSLFRTTITASLVLVHTDPIMVAFLAYVFLRERPARRTMAGFVVALAGVALITSKDGPGGAFMPGSGDLLALAGALAVAVYILLGRRLRRNLSVTTYAASVYLISAAFLFAGAGAYGSQLTGYGWAQYLMFLALALGPSVFGHTSFNYALKFLKASTVSVATLGEPLLASMLAILVFSEVPSTFTLVGAALVLSGLYYALR